MKIVITVNAMDIEAVDAQRASEIVTAIAEQFKKLEPMLQNALTKRKRLPPTLQPPMHPPQSGVIPQSGVAVEPTHRKMPLGTKRTEHLKEFGACDRVEQVWYKMLKEHPEGVLIKDVVREAQATHGTAWTAGMRLVATGEYEYFQRTDIHYRPRGVRAKVSKTDNSETINTPKADEVSKKEE